MPVSSDRPIEDSRIALCMLFLKYPPRLGICADADDVDALLAYIRERQLALTTHVRESILDLNRSLSTGRVPLTPYLGAMADALSELEGSFERVAEKLREAENEAALR